MMPDACGSRRRRVCNGSGPRFQARAGLGNASVRPQQSHPLARAMTGELNSLITNWARQQGLGTGNKRTCFDG